MESELTLGTLPLIHFRNQWKITHLEEAPESAQLSKVETLGKPLPIEAAK